MKPTFKSTLSLEEFSEKTTVHGLPKILSNESSVSKCVWLILFSGATAVFLIQSITLLSVYFSYPIQTVLGTERLDEFPSVTICNLRHIDPLINFLFLKSVTGDLPDDCGSASQLNETDKFLCYLKKKYEKQLNTYDFLRVPYDNIEKLWKKLSKEGSLPSLLKRKRNENFILSSFRSALGCRATFASNVLKSKLSNPEDFGFEFDHFIVKCRYGSRSCADIIEEKCRVSSDNDTWCFKRNQIGFKQVYDPNHYNCYTFNPTQFLTESMDIGSDDKVPPPMTGFQSGLDIVLLADGLYLPDTENLPSLLGLQVLFYSF